MLEGQELPTKYLDSLFPLSECMDIYFPLHAMFCPLAAAALGPLFAVTFSIIAEESPAEGTYYRSLSTPPLLTMPSWLTFDTRNDAHHTERSPHSLPSSESDKSAQNFLIISTQEKRATLLADLSQLNFKVPERMFWHDGVVGMRNVGSLARRADHIPADPELRNLNRRVAMTTRVSMFPSLIFSPYHFLATFWITSHRILQ